MDEKQYEPGANEVLESDPDFDAWLDELDEEPRGDEPGMEEDT